MEPLFKSKKQNNHKSGKLAEKKLRKRKEAEARQAKYDTLTMEQKLAKAKVGSKEHMKLLAKQFRSREK